MKKLIFTATALITMIILNYHQSRDHSVSNSPAVIAPYQTDIPTSGKSERTVLDSTQTANTLKGTGGS